MNNHEDVIDMAQDELKKYAKQYEEDTLLKSVMVARTINWQEAAISAS